MKKLSKKELINIKIAITSAITSDKKQENTATVKFMLLENNSNLTNSVKIIVDIINEKMKPLVTEYKELVKDYKENISNLSYNYWGIISLNIPVFEKDEDKQIFLDSYEELCNKYKSTIDEIEKLMDEEIEVKIETISKEDLSGLKNISYDALNILRKYVIE
jgi:DNA-binding Xre family transcriptional regulator